MFVDKCILSEDDLSEVYIREYRAVNWQVEFITILYFIRAHDEINSK